MCILDCTCLTLIESATAGQDYSNVTSAPLEFTAGIANGSMQCFTFTVYNDRILEYDEFFLVELTVITPRVMEGNAIANVTILSDLEDGEQQINSPTALNN